MMNESAKIVLQKTRCYFEVWFITSILIIVLALWFIKDFLFYVAGLTCSPVILVCAFMFIAPPVWTTVLGIIKVTSLLVIFLRATFLLFKVSLKRVSLEILFIILTFFFVNLIPPSIPHPYLIFTYGLMKNMERTADISTIQTWLDDIGTEGARKINEEKMIWSSRIKNIYPGDPNYEEALKNYVRFVRDDSKWPKAIRNLPHGTIWINELNNKPYVRTDWGGPLIGRFGLVVGARIEEIDEHHKDDCMIEIVPNAFVWSKLKGAP